MAKLSDPITIRGMEVKNRLAYPPMLSMSSRKGSPGKKNFKLHELKARGGIGLITFESTSMEPPETFVDIGLSNLGRDEQIPEFKELTDMVHQYGTKIGMQLGDGAIIGFAMLNAMTQFKIKGVNPVGPSKVDLGHATSLYQVLMPKWDENIKKNNYEIDVLSKKNILAIEDKYAMGAKRVIESGFDFIEIHSGHGTLFASFLSPWLNKRTDEYGGSIENKCRFAVETLKKIREKVGDKPPVFIRFSADELVGDGNRIEQGIEIAKEFEKGGFDCLDITQGIIYRSPFGIQIPSYCKQGCYIHLSEAIKREVDIPTIGVGRIIDPRMADEFIQQGKADIIYMGRQIICDPETPNKYFSGNADDIRFCMGCSQDCMSGCIQDAYGNQSYRELNPSTELKKIVILGAGIAGMETALEAKLRGHEVEIYEKSEKIGGLLPVVAAEYKKEDFMNSVKYLEFQLKKLGVPIHLNKEVTKEEISALNPDILVLAVGTEAVLPVKLKEKTNVLTQDEAVLKSKPIGKNVVVWGLDTYWRGGAETAITLKEQGYNVKALVGPEKTIANAISHNSGRHFLIVNYFRRNRLPVYYNAELIDVTETAVKFLDENKVEQSIEADTFVFCGSRISNAKKLKQMYEGVAPEIVLLGDAKKPRDIGEAFKDAQKYIRKLK